MQCQDVAQMLRSEATLSDSVEKEHPSAVSSFSWTVGVQQEGFCAKNHSNVHTQTEGYRCRRACFRKEKIIQPGKTLFLHSHIHLEFANNLTGV